MDIKNTIYEGMHRLFQLGTSYHLDGDAFTSDIAANIRETTGLVKSAWLGDWWVHPDNNPEMLWEEVVAMALQILHTEATRLFVSNLYLKAMPTYTIAAGQELPVTSVRGAKRVNAWRGTYQEFNMLSQQMGDMCDTGDKFRFSGKDESCCVEGTWFDWCCFACNVLASENTRIMCPALYEPMLANSNY